MAAGVGVDNGQTVAVDATILYAKAALRALQREASKDGLTAAGKRPQAVAGARLQVQPWEC